MDENEAVLRREIDEKERALKSRLDKEERFKYVWIAFTMLMFIIMIIMCLISPWEMKTQMDSNEQALQTQLTYVYGGIAGILIMLIIDAYYRIYYHPI